MRKKAEALQGLLSKGKRVVVFTKHPQGDYLDFARFLIREKTPNFKTTKRLLRISHLDLGSEVLFKQITHENIRQCEPDLIILPEEKMGDVIMAFFKSRLAFRRGTMV